MSKFDWKGSLRMAAQSAYTGKLVRGIKRILAAPEKNLVDPAWVLDVIRRIGLRYDRRGIYGSDAKYMNFLGPGLWQIPEQFAGALVKLGAMRPANLLEIGTCDGWTCSVMTAYLLRFYPGFRALTVDPINQFPAWKRVQKLLPVEFRQATSDDLTGEKFDLCFIDGDHSMDWVRRDFDQAGRFARICMFHDINDALAGNGAVMAFWQELKIRFPGKRRWEFAGHPEKVAVMGIGILQSEPEEG